MKTIILSAFCCLGALFAYCQQTGLQSVNNHRLEINRRGMVVLGSWSAANIIYGTIAGANTGGSTKYFHQMNAIWNGVTLGLVTLNLLTAKKEEQLSLSASLKKQSSTEKIFLFNAALDVAYIAGGLYLKERAKNSEAKNAERNKGYGESIMVQGAALLAFDAVLYIIHQNNGKQLYQIADNVHIAPSANGLSLVIGW